jgi:hypothetical protein
MTPIMVYSSATRPVYTHAHYGLCREDLLQDTINSALPACVSVGKLLDVDTMRRAY